MFKGKDDLTGAQTIQRQDKNERLQIPDLDMKMLDMIMQEGSEGRDFMTPVIDVKESDLDSDKRGTLAANIHRVTKGNESLKHEYNKQLLMELIIKKIGKDSKPYFSKNHLHSAIKLLIQDTMSRFKTMKTLYGNANFLNDYDRLYELVSGKELGINSAVEKEIESIKKSNKLDYLRYEALLRSRFIDCHQEIASRKNYISSLRKIITDKEEYLAKSKAKIDQLVEKNKVEEEELMAVSKKKGHKNIRGIDNVATSIEDMHKRQRIEQLIAHLRKGYAEEEARVKEDIDNNNADIKRIENEITDLKMKKVIYKYRLKECYISILKKPKLTM